MRKVLVAGATGNLGQYVALSLRQHDVWVRGLARESLGAARIKSLVKDVAVADATQRRSLEGACDGIHTVISCMGASLTLFPTTEKRSYHAVDTVGNLNLLEEAKAARVRKFIYISCFIAPHYAQSNYVQAHEAVVAELQRSGLDYTIIRPTGLFSSIAPLLRLARRGKLPLFAGDTSRTNPVDDRDVARVCLASLDSHVPEIVIGGPEILTRKEINDLVFLALGMPARYGHTNRRFLAAARPLLALADRRLADLIEFVSLLTRKDAIAPTLGTLTLRDYLADLIRTELVGV